MNLEGDKVFKKKVRQGPHMMPMILSFKRYAIEIDSVLGTQPTTELSEKNMIEYRVQNFCFQKHSKLNLLRGLPYQKYSKNLIKDPHFQVHIIEEELKLLFEKLKLLKSKLMEVMGI
jgi:hypothetical protein